MGGALDICQSLVSTWCALSESHGSGVGSLALRAHDCHAAYLAHNSALDNIVYCKHHQDTWKRITFRSISSSAPHR